MWRKENYLTRKGKTLRETMQETLLKHGDVITLRTTTEPTGWLYVDSNETPQLAYSVQLPIQDRRFQFQVLKLCPQVSGGNNNCVYVTEGDDILLKSLSNNLVLTFGGNACGYEQGHFNLGQEIATTNYYNQGEGSLSAVRFLTQNGAPGQDRAVLKGPRAYGIQFPRAVCYISAPPQQQVTSAGSLSTTESFILLPAQGYYEGQQQQQQQPAGQASFLATAPAPGMPAPAPAPQPSGGARWLGISLLVLFLLLLGAALLYWFVLKPKKPTPTRLPPPPPL
jgi:hypothetical protein